MTDAVQTPAAKPFRKDAHTARRYARERRFKFMGLAAIGIAVLALVMLLVSVVVQGAGAFWRTEVTLPVNLSIEMLEIKSAEDIKGLQRSNFSGLLKKSVRGLFPEVKKRKAKKKLAELVSPGAAFLLRDRVLENPSVIGQVREITLPLADDFNMLAKGRIDRDGPATRRRISDQQIEWFDTLVADGRISTVFNWDFFRLGDSSYPATAGIWGAVVGSFLTIVVTLTLAFPIGVAAALYLEEFAPKNRWTDLVEVNINNLAAVPSIVFGLLGLAIFLNVFGMPRSAPLVGGVVLALMTLPTIIIASRAALKAVPPSIREAALGVGASKMQAVFHHALPLAMPGILTGTIIGLAQALGETAPLLMIGMVAFIVDIPGGVTDPAAVLPVQIFLWADSPERGFAEKTAAAIMVLLAFLICMNLLAVILRRRFERRW